MHTEAGLYLSGSYQGRVQRRGLPYPNVIGDGSGRWIGRIHCQETAVVSIDPELTSVKRHLSYRTLMIRSFRLFQICEVLFRLPMSRHMFCARIVQLP